MSREQEFSKVKKLIKKFYNDAHCGFFDCRNFVGDPMYVLFNGSHFRLEICYSYSYFELFGATEEEFNKLEKFYNKLERSED